MAFGCPVAFVAQLRVGCFWVVFGSDPMKTWRFGRLMRPKWSSGQNLRLMVGCFEYKELYYPSIYI